MPTESLLRYWTLHGPGGHVATCELVRTAAGLEVRCDWSDRGAPARLANSAAVQAVGDALSLADSWKAAYIEKGWIAAAPRDRKAN